MINLNDTIKTKLVGIFIKAGLAESRADIQQVFEDFEEVLIDYYSSVFRFNGESAKVVTTARDMCMLIDAEVDLMRTIFSNPAFPFIYINYPDPWFQFIYMDKLRDFVSISRHSPRICILSESSPIHTYHDYKDAYDEVVRTVAFLEVSNAPDYIMEVAYRNTHLFLESNKGVKTGKKGKIL